MRNLQAFEGFNPFLSEVKLPLLGSLSGVVGGDEGKVGVVASVVQELGELFSGECVRTSGLELRLEPLVEVARRNVAQKMTMGLGA